MSLWQKRVLSLAENVGVAQACESMGVARSTLYHMRSLKYAIEVENSIYDARKRFSSEQIERLLISRYNREKKSSQLNK